MSQALLKGINRGCTYVEATGAYTHESKSDVFMVISSYELDHAKRVINAVDPNAFIMSSRFCVLARGPVVSKRIPTF